MHINSFEGDFPLKILNEGLNYYNNDHVLAIERKNDYHWIAKVKGSLGEIYNVEIFLAKGNKITLVGCDCAYKLGNCKHIAATLYKMRKSIAFENLTMKSRITSIDKTSFQTYYENLKEPAQRILKVLALQWSVSALNDIINIVKKAGFNKDNTDYNKREVQIIFDQFLKQKLIFRQGRGYYGLREAFSILLCDTYYSKDPDYERIAIAIYESNKYGFWQNYQSIENIFRDMRIARYQDNEPVFTSHFIRILNSGRKYNFDQLIEFWFGKDFDQNRITNIGPNVRSFLIYQKLNRILSNLLPLEEKYFQYSMENITTFPEEYQQSLASILIEINLFRNDWQAIKKLTPYTDPFLQKSTIGINLFMEGKYEEACIAFGFAKKILVKETKDRKIVLNDLDGLFFLLAQLKLKSKYTIAQLKKYVERVEKYESNYLEGFKYLEGVFYFLLNEQTIARQILKNKPRFDLFKFFQVLGQYWVDDSLINISELKVYHRQLHENGYAWMAAEINTLLERLEHVAEGLPVSKSYPLVDILPKINKWEVVLQALTRLSNGGKKQDTANRLVWLVDFDNNQILPKHQTLGKKGWTKGRAVAFNRLLKQEIPGMTKQDIAFVNAIGYANGSVIYLYHNKIDNWKFLVGHPLLFLEKSPTTPVQLEEVKPSLIAKENPNGYKLSFNYDVSYKGPKIIKASPTKYLYLEVSEKIARIAQSFDGTSIEIPTKGKEQLQTALSGLAEIMPVESAFEDVTLPAVEADNRICVHLLPVGDGFHVETYVKPFGLVPPYVKPGLGEANLIGILEGERHTTTRDLKVEEKNLKALRKAVPSLKQKRPQDGVWKMEEAEQCLQLLVELKPLLEKEEILLEWPRGEQLAVNSIAGFDNFRMSINGVNTWFELEGELQVDEETVLNLKELLHYSEQQSQFIELSPGKFLALTEEFRKKLKSINGLVSTQKKNDTLLLHPLAVPAFDPFSQAVTQLEADQKFKESMEKLKLAYAKKYRVSKTFNATLRTYQKEGYEWLQRCATWGVGACLADDMGLGKTIQALAFLTARSNEGPALVVAPASVCRNWIAETERFAPKLKPVLFGDGDREATINKAQKGSLVIVTYDLMAREEKRFSEKDWATVILDEAQAIKNQATKRSDAAMALKAKYKIAMTGTPVENHLGELWNLFQFLNPGLLGSKDQFNERFAIPIEKYNNEDRRAQLQRLIKPFILRRKKDEVLKELPKKTEITLRVELPEKERAFYEALRRNAIEKLADDDEGAKPLQILAEIMKLRRAACHPSLADANAGFKEGAKLKLFGEVIDELLENSHKVLVFSQFVAHLKLLENHLKEKNISYQYLDGSIPTKKRQKAIDDFQNGEGDVFLISLKAGGTGLNLTAADYVIHMDPWWNPAVEDQATDRAHRIGQEKPVTVYRLVAQQTIEEKILKLHAQKRDLADSLLAGTNASAKLTAKELMKLLKD